MIRFSLWIGIFKRSAAAVAAGFAIIMVVTSGDVRAIAQQISAGSPLQAGRIEQRAASRAVLDQYCVSCHNQKLRTSGLALDELSLAAVGEEAQVWEDVLRKLRGGLMPPQGRARPDAATYTELVTWLEAELDRAAIARPDPGRTEAFHRLNRAEYANVIRDLLALDIDVSPLLPADDASYGFDNMAGVLKVSESLLEQYLSTARKVARMAVGSPLPLPNTDIFPVSPELSQGQRLEGLPFGTRGGTVFDYYFPREAEYEVVIDLACTDKVDLKCDGRLGFSESHQLELLLDEERVQLFMLEPKPQDFGNLIQSNENLRVRVPVKAGSHRVGVTFVKTLPDREIVRNGYRKRFERPFRLNADAVAIAMPYLESVTIAGPFDASGPGHTPSRQRIFSCRPLRPVEELPCAKEILSTLIRRAYRRPVTDRDRHLEALLTFYNEGRANGGFDTGIETAIRALLVSPEFLFRVERDPPNASPTTPYRVSDLELASRLSFFLWSSIPDDELLELAAHGKLKDPVVLRRQAQRMLSDARSRALVDNFVGQWLKLRNVVTTRPSESIFPDFDENLRQGFRRETEMFFESILHENRSVMDLLTADYTFVNERLAAHYGIPNVNGSHFRRVTYPDQRRRGLLGQGSVLTVTSHPTRTSPVLRGKWIMENILGTAPPPPPPVVPPLRETEFREKVLGMRERMAQHRANPACSSCHSMIDPIGFALENFDAVGRWRNVDEAFIPVNPAGVLPDGTDFDTLSDFREALASRPERFVGVVTEKVLAYALGRGLEYYDMPTVRRITRDAARNNYALTSLVLGVIESLPFQMRRVVAQFGESVATARAQP